MKTPNHVGNCSFHLYVDDQLVLLQDPVSVVPEPEHEADSRTLYDLNIQIFRFGCAKCKSNNLLHLDGVKAGHDGAPVVGAGRLSYLGGYEVEDPRGGHVVEI